jgi:hypothetical protein
VFGRRTAWATFAVAVAAALLFAAPALAAQPANDDFANAATVPSSLPETISGSTLDATTEPSEPAHWFNGPTASVWYAWTPAADDTAKIQLCDSTIEPSISVGVYTGTAVGSLTRVSGNNLGCRLYFHAAQDQQYMIAVDSMSTDDEGPFQVLLRALAPPPNDDLSNAQVLSQEPEQTVSGSTVDATMEPGEPSHLYHHGPPDPGVEGSVWYEWTSDANGGAVTLDACADFRPAVGVYAGSAYGALSSAGADPDEFGLCSQSFTAAPSTTYSIAVASLDEYPFDLTVTYQPNDDPPPPPGDDPPPGDRPTPAAGASVATGQVAGAVKKCKKAKKKKHRRAHRSCAKRAKRLGA